MEKTSTVAKTYSVSERKILSAGSSAAEATLVRRLAGRGYLHTHVRSARECLASFSTLGADLVILALPLPDLGGADLIRELRSVDERVPLILVGRDPQVQTPSDGFRLGAVESLDELSSEAAELLAAVGTALGGRRGDAQLAYLRQREAAGASWESLIGTSAAMRDVVAVVQRVCERTTRGTAPTLLILGETGTGKGLLARCIHFNGVRRNQPFVELNCAAIPATLLEAELFGHERGAFTDARTSRAGLFETAHRGTIFLDEIGNMPLDLQAKLLTVLEEKRVRRLGGRQPIQVDVQIVAATHVALSERVRAQAFRADLYHRLNVVSVTMPPLRSRGEDVVLLAESFLQAMCREYGTPVPRLTEDAKEYIRDYSWPGNVRELKNQMERLVLLVSDEDIEAHHFDRPSLPPPSSRAPIAAPSRKPIAENPPRLLPTDENLGLDEIEREWIRRALARVGGNVSQAARVLKVSRQTLMYRIKKHAL
jgi:two-component system, NtrC family, response regulator AtoC